MSKAITQAITAVLAAAQQSVAGAEVGGLDADAIFKGALAEIQELTDTAKLREAREEFVMAGIKARHGIALANAHGRLMEANAHMADMLVAEVDAYLAKRQVV